MGVWEYGSMGVWECGLLYLGVTYNMEKNIIFLADTQGLRFATT